jgi:predicted metal-dependent hydrolase
MPIIEDNEFGVVTVRRSSRATSMRVTVAPNGTLRVSVPTYAPMFMVKRMIASSREQLRAMLNARPKLVLTDGMSIGKSHTLLVRQTPERSIRRVGQQLIVGLPDGETLRDDDIVTDVRAHMRTILRKEAKAHLPHRLKHLAQTNGFEFESVRFTHASSRWGSCNHKKAISLNIALMNLPFELIDYVLVHELAHTKHLDHSPRFWSVVESVDPDFKRHRKALKAYDPTI